MLKSKQYVSMRRLTGRYGTKNVFEESDEEMLKRVIVSDTFVANRGRFYPFIHIGGSKPNYGILYHVEVAKTELYFFAKPFYAHR